MSKLETAVIVLACALALTAAVVGIQATNLTAGAVAGSSVPLIQPVIDWFKARFHDYGALNTDQTIALWAAIITAAAALFALIALIYARSAVVEARKAIVVSRNATREERAARRLQELQRLRAPLDGVATAAATAQAQPIVGLPKLHDAQSALRELLYPFTASELPHCFAAVDDRKTPKMLTAEAKEGSDEVGKLIDSQRDALTKLASVE